MESTNSKVTFLYIVCTDAGKEESVTFNVFVDIGYTGTNAKAIYSAGREKLERVIGKEMADKCYLVG